MSASTEDRVSAGNGSASEDQRTERAAEGKREARWSSRRKEGVVLPLIAVWLRPVAL